MSNAEDKILAAVNKYEMLSDGDRVILAVSGGADSMCMLHFFNKISSKMHLNIICAHVNHGMRGAEADRDEDFVRSFCEANDIDFRAAHFSVPTIAKTTGESEEQCGRRLRYGFFASIDKEAKVATAHNLNDCAETFLFNLARGTGLKGLTGIPPVRGNIIRPLIECTREEIESYLSENGISYITDSTNLNDCYSRNKIRHNALPVLENVNSGFFSVFSGCLSSLAADEAFLDKTAQKAFDEIMCDSSFDIQKIKELDESVKRRLLIKIGEFFGAREVSGRQVSLLSALLDEKGAVMLSGGVTVASDGKKLFSPKRKAGECEIYEKYSPERSYYEFPGCSLSVKAIDKNAFDIYNIKKPSYLNFLDADKLKDAVFRSRIDGDRFKYPNAEHSKSLKNLFKEKNITPEDRYGVPMLCSDDGILWINGVGVSDKAKITDKTKNIIEINITERHDEDVKSFNRG